LNGGGTEQQLILPFTNHKKLKLQIACQQEQTEEFQPDVKRVAAYMNYHEVRQIVDIAKTVMARDYKGFSSGFDSTNGVIEWK
jgi:hypothetical protein